MSNTARKYCSCGRPLECPCGEIQLEKSKHDDVRDQFLAALRLIARDQTKGDVPQALQIVDQELKAMGLR
jgi:hypothetical protein